MARMASLWTVSMLLVASMVWNHPASANDHAVDGQKVNPELAKFHERYKPALVKTSPRVHAVNSYDYSAYGYIEGDDGVIVVDTGWFPGQAKRSIADYRKITDKPIVAIIYTHLHLDHYGGAKEIMAGQNPDIPVYGPKGWQGWVNDSFSTLRPAMYKRIFMQMGMLLPDGEEGTVGSGVGSKPAIASGGTSVLSFPPTIDVAEYTKLNISGVNIHLIPTPGDLNEHLYVWLPDDKVLFVGDVLAGTFPAIETVRFEAERDPQKQIEAYKRALELKPNYIIGGHGRVLMGAEDARDVMQANLDVTEFMVDQLDRLYLKGLSADQVIDQLKLPPALESHPDMQRHYHRLEWMIKTMHLKRAGFVGSSMDYVTLTESEEAKRLVKLLGGTENVMQSAQQALESGEPRWAARLATYALEVDPASKAALKLRQKAFLKVAQKTDSANERNYLLTIIKDENGEIDWKGLFSNADLQIIREQDTEAVLKLMKVRFRAEDANNDHFVLKLDVTGDAEPHYLNVRNNTLFLLDGPPAAIDGEATMSRDTLDHIAANKTDWRIAVEQGQLQIANGRENFERLAALIE